MKRRALLPAILALVAAWPSSVQACAVCMGDPNSEMARASNSVLWMLLGLVGFIFVSTGLTVVYLWRRDWVFWALLGFVGFVVLSSGLTGLYLWQKG